MSPIEPTSMNSAYYFLSFALMQKKGTKKKSRLNENFLFSTDRLKHAIQAAPLYILHLDVGVLQTFERSLEKVPMYASVSLTNTHRIEPSLENLRNFHKVGPTNSEQLTSTDFNLIPYRLVSGKYFGQFILIY
jgi:hypothetical protein